MVVVSLLSHQYEGGKTLFFPDFSVERGKACLLVGNSGCGKTTLLHLLGGLLTIQKGHVQVGGLDIAKVSEPQRDKFRGKHIGFIFQKNHLISALSVRKNLLMAPFLANMPQDEDRVDEVLAQLGLWERKHAKVGGLSQGQAQRVSIARAILNKPDIILADEPTSALDDVNCDKVIRLLLNASQINRSTLVIATHDHRLKSVISQQVEMENYVS